jgi:hypothetical protein
MQLGLDNGQVYFEYEACRWDVGNIREECDRRAVDIANFGNKVMLGMSSGVDSQIVLLSFLEQNIPIECVFMYLPGHNEYEYANLKILEKAWGFKAQIIDFDPMKIKDELMAEALELDIPPYQLMHKKMLSMLPESYDYLEGVSGPFIPFKNDKPYYFEGYHSYEVSRHRGFNTLNRTGRNILYDRNSEFILSILEKKYQGPETIDYIMNGPPNKWPENYIIVPMDEFITSLKKPVGSVTRYYERQVD